MLNSLHYSITPCTNTTIIDEYGFFKPCVDINDFEWSVVISIIYVGGLCGNFLPNFTSKYISPIIVLWVGNLPSIIGVLLIFFFSSKWAFIIGRFLMGFTAGLTWNIGNFKDKLTLSTYLFFRYSSCSFKRFFWCFNNSLSLYCNFNFTIFRNLFSISSWLENFNRIIYNIIDFTNVFSSFDFEFTKVVNSSI